MGDENRIIVEEARLGPDEGVGVRFKRDTEVRGKVFRAHSRATLSVDEAKEIADRARGGRLRQAARKVMRSRASLPVQFTDASAEELREIGVYEDKMIHVEKVK